MCTASCKCYSGDNGSTRDLWKGYGNTVLNLYNRNADELTYTDENTTTYPFSWEDDPEKAVHSFKQCYEEKLLPGRKYTSEYDTMVKEFYGSGGFLFLMGLESEHEGCASVCETPLFFLLRDISEGMPKTECIREQITESSDLSANVASWYNMIGLIMYINITWVVPLFFGYHSEEP
jgi:hypothetical protein